ncbi:MAG: hypothetical protein LBU62_00650 [Bacteroidales bacterium]|jgi:hypothetical protein|nr:hypothetical protein [Bacteroidales bacterium]
MKGILIILALCSAPFVCTHSKDIHPLVNAHNSKGIHPLVNAHNSKGIHPLVNAHNSKGMNPLVSADSSKEIHPLVSDIRRQMTNLVWEGRLDSVMTMLENFEQDHPRLKAVAPSERLLLYFWSERYGDIFRFLRQKKEVSSFELEVSGSKLEDSLSFLGDEGLWNVLSHKTSEHISDLYDWIDQTDLYDDEIQFLRDLLADLTKEDELQATDKRLSAYREDTSDQPSSSEWSFGMGLEAGPAFFSGDITRIFQPKAYFSLDFDLRSNRWDMAFLLQFAATSLQRDVPLKDSVTIWGKGATADFLNMGLTLGYAVVKNDWFRFTPYVGLMVNTIRPTETAIANDANLSKVNIVSFGQCYGATAQLRICQIRELNAEMTFITRFQYVPHAYNHSGVRYQGDFWSLMFGLSFYGFFSN